MANHSKVFSIPLIAGLFLVVSGIGAVQAEPPKSSDKLFQVSTLQALIQGALEGTVSQSDLRKYGDFGIGTFDGLDGEMIALDGTFYQARWGGDVSPASLDLKSPFAEVCFFRPNQVVPLDGTKDIKALVPFLDSKLQSRNFIHAIRIEGLFEYVKARAPAKLQRPYPNLTTVTDQFSVFEFFNTEGTLVGFRFPEAMSGINMAGYHFHFLTKDRKRGGHVLDLLLKNVDIKIQQLDGFEMQMPKTAEFYQANLEKRDDNAVHKIER